ncbi:serine hydrolase domain-containing protein [Nonomuraea sp. JJY05]|uniref:serine hydrolase domain-containing protein n=1 Tax=Nonomuraea sp. JJY05 TaxID=3350255 RepID=UPI00373E3953
MATRILMTVAAIANLTTGSHPLQRDVDAIIATGASGILVQVQSGEAGQSFRAGIAEHDSHRPVPWNAYYRIGSDTKTFTAVIALQLVGEGKLALTDTVEKWLPGLIRGNGNDGRKITVKNLLRQTSGLPDYVPQLPIGKDLTPDGYLRERFRTFTPRALVKLAMRQPPQWMPGDTDPAEETRWAYSNTNYLLMGLIIEKVTGHPWAREIHDRILRPLGLRHTITPGTSAYVPEPTARAYSWFPGATRPTDTSILATGGPDGGLISTPGDLTTFLRALLGGRLLKPEQLAAMRQTVEAKDWIAAAGTRYGLGIAWRPATGCAHGIWFHGGTNLGIVSESGVTGDGRRAAAAATFTLRFSAAQIPQDKASIALIDHALCRPD